MWENRGQLFGEQQQRYHHKGSKLDSKQPAIPASRPTILAYTDPLQSGRGQITLPVARRRSRASLFAGDKNVVLLLACQQASRPAGRLSILLSIKLLLFEKEVI